MADQVKSHLEKGNKLCSSRRTPMNPKVIAQVKEIHSKCKTILDVGRRQDTPLILAARLGLAHMVWGLIECAKNPNRDLDTNFDGGFQAFLGQKNWYGNTALHVAAANSHVDVVKVLLLNVSLRQLISCRNRNGQTPLSQLGNPKYDEDIFACLERARSTEMEMDAGTSTIISSDDEQEGSILYLDNEMDPLSYMRSYISGTRDSSWQRRYAIRELGPHNDTMLHLVAKIGNVEYMKDIIEKHSSLMYYRNIDGEIPAFVAAKEGQLDILQMMLHYFKRKTVVVDNIQSLMTRTKGNQSALHIAIQNHHAGVVFWLVKEVPGLIHHVNEDNKSPLNVAVDEGHDAIVKLILDKCTLQCFSEPHDAAAGRTELHEAARTGSVETIKSLLESNPLLFYERDNRELMPLDVAVVNGHLSATQALLDHNCSIGYQIRETRDEDVSTIHIAAIKDHCDILKYLISKCPGCIDVTNREGRNILHVAIEYSSIKVIKFIFEHKPLTELINQKDNDGNTPIHLFVEKASYIEKISDLDIMNILMDTRVDLDAINNKSQTPIDKASSKEERSRFLQATSQGRSKWAINEAYVSEEAQNDFKMMDQIVLVAALIATASFAAGFTVPGGFDGNEGSKQGMPVLLKEFAYKVFVVANALAFTCSCCALFGNVRMLISRFAPKRNYQTDLNRIHGRTFAMYILTGMAMVAMAVAFITGTYVVLTPSLSFGILVCSMCGLIFVITILFDVKLGGLVHEWFTTQYWVLNKQKVMHR